MSRQAQFSGNHWWRQMFSNGRLLAEMRQFKFKTFDLLLTAKYKLKIT